MRRRRARSRWRAGTAGAVALLGAAAPQAARAATPGGYELSTAADAIAWVPILPGFVPGADSPGEISLSDTAAALATGGVAYGRGALNYPGSFGAHLGPLMEEEGAPAAAAQAIPPWPTLAEAGGNSGQVTNTQVPGATIQAYGSARRASGDSVLPGITLPGALEVGSITTHSQTLVDGSAASARSTTVLHNVSLGGGAVTISAFSSSSWVDGSQPGGSVQVTGMKVGGISATVDARGVHALGASVPGSDLNQQVFDSLAAAKLKLSVAEPVTSRTKGAVSRQAGGLLVGVLTPESPAASAGVILVELGATAASVATSPGALGPVGATPGGAVLSPTGGPASAGAAPGGGVLPAVAGGGLSAAPLGGSQTGPASVPAPSGPGGVVGAINSLGALASYTFGGIPVGVVVIALLLLGLGSWGVSVFVRRLAAFREGEMGV